MIQTVTGSKYVGSYIKNSDAAVLTVLGALDNMNNPAIQTRLRGVDDLVPFIDTLEGINGHKESFKSINVLGVRDGEYLDAPTMQETLENWFYTRSGIKVKDYEFSLSLVQDAYERDIPLQDVVTERVKAVGDWLI